MGLTYKSADFKSEKHVPVIECADSVASGAALQVTVTVGKEIAHPNTTEHHIRWIRLYFQPENGPVYEVANVEFTAHGEAVAGANQGPAFTSSCAVVELKLNQSGTLMAASYCNIHGLWESAKAVKVG